MILLAGGDDQQRAEIWHEMKNAKLMPVSNEHVGQHFAIEVKVKPGEGGTRG